MRENPVLVALHKGEKFEVLCFTFPRGFDSRWGHQGSFITIESCSIKAYCDQISRIAVFGHALAVHRSRPSTN